jgi:uncharacterized protein YciI
MIFHIYCQDKPDHGAVRAANRNAHIAYLEPFRDKLILGGPMLSDDGQSMIGSVIVIDLPDRAEVDKFLAGDPYGQAGLFASVAVRPFKKVFP